MRSDLIENFAGSDLRSRRPKMFLGSFLVLALAVILVLTSIEPLVLAAPDTNSDNKVEQRKLELREQLEALRQQINEYRQKIKALSGESKTLQREISLMESQIHKLELQIQQSELAISELQILIEQKSTDISQITNDIDSQKSLLAEYLRNIYLYEQKDLVEIVLAVDSFSDFFEQLRALEVIQAALKSNVDKISQLKEKLQAEKTALEVDEDEQKALQALQEIQQITLWRQRGEKQTLLTETKGEEGAFRKLVEQTQQNIDALRNRLYLLEGVGVSISLSEAVARAQKVCQTTGIRPAFLLAVLKQESSWGKNVGSGNWQRDMRLSDKEAFLAICNKLGLNPDQMPVSGKPWYGWGGAMGAAQFLPTTWLAYEAEIAQLTGHNPPSPWDLEDAFAAAAIKLARDGATAKTYDSEWKAAMIYFAGSRWNNPLYSFYGDSVMNVAQVIQEQIDLIQG